MSAVWHVRSWQSDISAIDSDMSTVDSDMSTVNSPTCLQLTVWHVCSWQSDMSAVDSDMYAVDSDMYAVDSSTCLQLTVWHVCNLTSWQSYKSEVRLWAVCNQTSWQLAVTHLSRLYRHVNVKLFWQQQLVFVLTEIVTVAGGIGNQKIIESDSWLWVLGEHWKW